MPGAHVHHLCARGPGVVHHGVQHLRSCDDGLAHQVGHAHHGRGSGGQGEGRGGQGRAGQGRVRRETARQDRIKDVAARGSGNG